MNRKTSVTAFEPAQVALSYGVLHGCGNDSDHYHVVEGYKFRVRGYTGVEFFVCSYRNGSWAVSEASTGLLIPGSRARTRSAAVEGAKRSLKKNADPKKIQRAIRRELKKLEKANAA